VRDAPARRWTSIALRIDPIAVTLGGDPTSQPRVSHTARLEGPPAFGDVDGDGQLDVVVHAGALVSVHLGHGDGTFRAPMYFDSGLSNAFATALGDVDRDGRVDIVVAHANGVVSVLHGRCL